MSSEKRMATSERVNRWSELIYQAECASLIGAAKISVDLDLLLETNRYLESLGEELLNKTVVVGLGCSVDTCDQCGAPIEEDQAVADKSGDHAVKCNETMKVPHKCEHCGAPVIGACVKTSYGWFHPHCHGAAQQSRVRG